MNINWRVRFKNPVFWVQILGSIALPVLAYYGLTYEDFTTWGAVVETLVDAFKNPFVVGTMVWAAWSAINDPNVAGLRDSRKALTYDKPKDPKGL